jgi:L-ascorbate metabolism protein UlaG (beta-lactamase superfamily)
MRSILAVLGSISLSALVLAQAPPASTAPTPSSIPATGGNIYISPIKHASFQIEFNNRFVQVDPITTNNNAQAVMADIVLVTDIHGDHMDSRAIELLRKTNGVVVAPAAVRDALVGKSSDIKVLANGQSAQYFGMTVEAVPMYNLVRKDPQGQLFHTKGRGNGYILTIGGKRLYIAGDTECTPEMKALKNIDVAFLPMNLPYTMTPAEVADCAKAFAPKVVYPYHYNTADNAQAFADAMKGTAGVEVRLAGWYPAPPAPARQGRGGR